jgi:hypothetical protein
MLGRNMDFISYICSKSQADAQLAALYDVAVTNSQRRKSLSCPTCHPMTSVIEGDDDRVTSRDRNHNETALLESSDALKRTAAGNTRLLAGVASIICNRTPSTRNVPPIYSRVQPRSRAAATVM